MDESHAHLLAAAETLRTWAHSRRRTWTDVPLPEPEAPRSTRPTIDWRPFASILTARVAERWRDAFPLVRGCWREGLLATAIVTAAWAAATYSSSWTPGLGREWERGERIVSSTRATVRNAVTVRASTPRHGSAPGATGKRTGRLELESTPTGAHAIVDGRERGVTPLTIDGLPAGAHWLVLRGSGGVVRRSVTVADGETTRLSEGIFSGWLRLSSPVELLAWDGTRPIRLDDRNQALLPPGSHDIRVENRASGFIERRRVEIEPGETTLMLVVPPNSTMMLTATPPAEVTVDGEPAGTTPLTDFPVAVGTRDIVVKAGSGDIRRITLNVTVQPVHVDVDFSRP